MALFDAFKRDPKVVAAKEQQRTDRVALRQEGQTVRQGQRQDFLAANPNVVEARNSTVQAGINAAKELGATIAGAASGVPQAAPPAAPALPPMIDRVTPPTTATGATTPAQAAAAAAPSGMFGGVTPDGAIKVGVGLGVAYGVAKFFGFIR